MKIFLENALPLSIGENLILHDNTRPHSSRIMQEEKIMDLGWFILAHPPDLSDLASSDFHLFCSLQNVFRKKRWKHLWKTCRDQNQLNFTWEESTNNLINNKKWYKRMVNILVIEIYSLLNYSKITFYWNGNYLWISQISIYLSIYLGASVPL